MWLGTDTTHTGSHVDRRDQTMFEYRLISLSLSPWLGTAPLYIPFRHERVYFIKINTNQDRWFFCCVLFFCSRVCVCDVLAAWCEYFFFLFGAACSIAPQSAVKSDCVSRLSVGKMPIAACVHVCDVSLCCITMRFRVFVCTTHAMR